MSSYKVRGQKQLKEWVLTKEGEAHSITPQITVGQFLSYLYVKDRVEMPERTSALAMQLIAEELWDIPIAGISHQLLMEACNRALVHNNANAQKQLRYKFKKIFLNPAVSFGLLQKKNFDYPRGAISEFAGSNPDSIEPSRRTLRWYVAEAISRNESGPRHPSTYKRACKDLLDYKAKDLKREVVLQTINGLNPTTRTRLRDVLDIMIEDGLLDSSIYHKDKTATYTFDNDTWEVMDGKKKTTLDFQALDEVDELKTAVKYWMQWRINKGYKTLRRSFHYIVIGFMPFLKQKEINLKQFGSKYKKSYHVWIRGALESGKHTRGVLIDIQKSTKSLVVFMQENHPKRVNTKVKWVKGEGALRRDEKKTNGYAPFEIQELKRAIGRDKDRLTVLLVMLLLLTGKRLNEIRTLKRNCLIDIAGIKYLKYTNTKIKKEERLPLSSKQDKSLFEKDVSSLVADCVKELLELTKESLPLSNKKEQGYLFVVRFGARRKDGTQAGLIPESLVYQNLKVFKNRNRIKFEISPKRSRNTIATKIIRSGHSAVVASRVLGNAPATVHRYYHADIQRIETVRIADKAIISPSKDAKELNELNQVPKAVTSKQASQMGTTSVPGGECKKGPEGAKQCPYYDRMFGGGGCLGCSELVVTTENKPWYDHMDKACLREIEQLRGTPFVASARNKHRLVSGALTQITNLKDIND